MFYIDIGRHGYKDKDEFINEFRKIDAWLKQKDGSMGYKNLNLDKGIDHNKEYSDIALMLIDSIVYHQSSFETDSEKN